MPGWSLKLCAPCSAAMELAAKGGAFFDPCPACRAVIDATLPAEKASPKVEAARKRRRDAQRADFEQRLRDRLRPILREMAHEARLFGVAGLQLITPHDPVTPTGPLRVSVVRPAGVSLDVRIDIDPLLEEGPVVLTEGPVPPRPIGGQCGAEEMVVTVRAARLPPLRFTSYEVVAVVDAVTCAACEARAGCTVAAVGETPPELSEACEHVKAGTGICRCVYRRIG